MEYFIKKTLYNTRGMAKRKLSFILLLLACLPVYVLAWGQSDIQYSRHELVIGDQALQNQSDGLQGATSQCQMLQETKIIIEVPEKIRLGQKATVRVYIEPSIENDADIHPAALQENMTGEYLEARLDLSSAGVEPQGNIHERLNRSEKLSYFWLINPGEEGEYRGTLWLYYGEENNEQCRMAMLARPVSIECVSLFHLNLTVLNWLSIAFLSFIIVIFWFLIISK